MNTHVVGLEIAKNIFHFYSLGEDGKATKTKSKRAELLIRLSRNLISVYSYHLPIYKPMDYLKFLKDKNAVYLFLFYVLVIGGIGIFFYAIGSAAGFFALFGVATMISFASFVSGSLLGFLFGLPVSVQPETQKNQQPSDSSGKNSHLTENQLENILSNNRYRGNTNLEDISNWLTKILLGVGLTQIRTIRDAIEGYANFAAPAFGNQPNSKFFATSILIYFLICGFIYGYIWTRLNLALMFSHADNADAEVIAQQKTQISKILQNYFSSLFLAVLRLREIKDRAVQPYCPLEYFGAKWITLGVIDKNKGIKDILALFRYYDRGIVLALGCGDLLLEPKFYTDKDGNDWKNLAQNDPNKTAEQQKSEWKQKNCSPDNPHKELVTVFFDELLDMNKRKKRVVISTGHNEQMTMNENSPHQLTWLANILWDLGYTIEDIDSLNTSNLNKADILIVGDARSNFKDKEIKAVENFVLVGGSLLVTGMTGWWWEDLLRDKDDKSLIKGQDENDSSTYPMNRLVKPYKMSFLFDTSVAAPSESSIPNHLSDDAS